MSVPPCVGSVALLPLVSTLLQHPTWDTAQKLRALYGLKKEACDCETVCDRYTDVILLSDSLIGLRHGG